MENQKIEGREFAREYNAFIRSGRTYVGLIAILEDENLKPAARVLFQIISSLCYKEGHCFATNQTLAEKLGLKQSMTKQYLQELEAYDLIEVKKVKCSYGIRRHITLRFDVLRKRYLVS